MPDTRISVCPCKLHCSLQFISIICRYATVGNATALSQAKFYLLLHVLVKTGCKTFYSSSLKQTLYILLKANFSKTLVLYLQQEHWRPSEVVITDCRMFWQHQNSVSLPHPTPHCNTHTHLETSDSDFRLGFRTKYKMSWFQHVFFTCQKVFRKKGICYALGLKIKVVSLWVP